MYTTSPSRPRTVVAILLALIVSAFVNPAAAGAGGPRRHRAAVDEQVRAAAERTPDQPQRVIIRVRPGSRDYVRRALAEHGDQIVADHSSIDAITATVHGEDIEELSANESILTVSSDAVVRADGLLGGLLNIVGGLLKVVGTVLLPGGADTSGPPVPPAVLRSTLGLSSTWTGRGIGVAVLDSGLEMSSEFSGRVRAFYDFTRGGVQVTPYDDFGHGTHVAGTIGGSGALSNSAEYRGIAPSVRLVIFKVLDKNGAGWTSDVIRAIDFAVANRAALGIDVINLSLGHPILEPAATDPLVQAVERAVRAGVIVVAAAGNHGKNAETGQVGYAGITSPGNAPSAITVGALRTEDSVSRADDRVADYSSSGPTWYDGIVKPDVVAPGHNIFAAAAKRSSLYKTYPQLRTADGDYFRLSGTSMAAAVTTGAIAQLLEANRDANDSAGPRLSASAVKALLQYTAVGIEDANGVEYDMLRKGAGALNPKGAIALGRAVDTSAPVGSHWLTSMPYPWTRIGSADLAWSKSITWGTQIIWGTSIAANQVAWAKQIIWGTSVDWTDQIIWGTNLVWSNAAEWSDQIIWGTQTIGMRFDDQIIWGTTGGLTPDNVAWANLSESGATATSVTASSTAAAGPAAKDRNRRRR
jgi:serine protease AprX